MGVTVVDERPYEIKAPGGARGVDVRLRAARGARATASTLDRFGAAFQEAFAQLWRGAVESDGFNRLVLLAGLTWREITVLRAACKYLRQAGMTFSQTYVEECLAKHPGIARQLLRAVRGPLRPEPPGPTGQGQAGTGDRLVAAIESGLEAVESLDEDRILRRFLHLIQAMLRTNYFQREPDGTSHPVSVLQAGAFARPRPAPSAARVRGLRALAEDRGACTSGAPRWPGAASVGRIAGRTSAPRSSG